MAGWHLSEQARQALRTARDLARGRRAPGSADPLLVAILERWDDERAGGPALLRACGLTADQAGQIAATLLPAAEAGAGDPGQEPRVIGSLRFVLDQAERIAAEARAPYVGTEHLVVAILWQDCFIGAQELRRRGVDHARARERLAALPATEQAEAIDPLEEAEVPTPAGGPLHVRQEHGRPGVVAGADPSRRVGPRPARGARPAPRPRVLTWADMTRAGGGAKLPTRRRWPLAARLASSRPEEPYASCAS
jgi:ATP-dependent Clp protease ATP-binding subunit ClpA